VVGAMAATCYGVRIMQGRMIWQEPKACDNYALRPPVVRKDKKGKKEFIWGHKLYPCLRCGKSVFKHDKRPDCLKDWIIEQERKYNCFFKKQKRTLKSWHEQDAAAALRDIQNFEQPRIKSSSLPKPNIRMLALQNLRESFSRPYNKINGRGSRDSNLVPLPLTPTTSTSTDESSGKVWLGNLRQVSDPEKISQLGITHIINTANATIPTPARLELEARGISILELNLNQTGDAFASEIVSAARFIHEAIHKDESVLVFGGNEIGDLFSIAPPTAFLMAYQNLDLKSCQKTYENHMANAHGRPLSLLGEHLEVTRRLRQFQRSQHLASLRHEFMNVGTAQIPQSLETEGML